LFACKFPQAGVGWKRRRKKKKVLNNSVQRNSKEGGGMGELPSSKVAEHGSQLETDVDRVLI